MKERKKERWESKQERKGGRKEARKKGMKEERKRKKDFDDQHTDLIQLRMNMNMKETFDHLKLRKVEGHSLIVKNANHLTEVLSQ